MRRAIAMAGAVVVLALINALAAYEKLEGPSEEAKARLIEHGFLEQHHVMCRGELREIAVPAGIVLLVYVPGDEADRRRVERLGLRR